MKYIMSIIIAFLLAITLSQVLAAFSEPSQAPPGGNTPEPINASGTAQVKLGSLGVASDSNTVFQVFKNAFLATDVGTRVGIGTTTPGLGYKLDVQGGQINASGGLCIAGDCRISWPGGISSETDPTVTPSVKDGVSWGELSGIPGGCPAGQFVTSISGGPACQPPASSGGGGDVSFPDGLSGASFVHVRVWPWTPQTVPSGQRLYIQYATGDVWVNNDGVVLLGNRSQRQPLILDSGWSYTTNNTGGIVIYGFLVPARSSITPVAKNTCSFGVPGGKKFVHLGGQQADWWGGPDRIIIESSGGDSFEMPMVIPPGYTFYPCALGETRRMFGYLTNL